MSKCQWCECIAAALSEVGLSPERVVCTEVSPDRISCMVDCSKCAEGLPMPYIEQMTDKAIELCLAKIGDKP